MANEKVPFEHNLTIAKGNTPFAQLESGLLTGVNKWSAPIRNIESAGLSDRKMEDNALVNVDAILQAILGRGGERFGMAAAVLRGERIIAQGVAGVRKRGTAERITLDDQFLLGSCTKAMTATLVAMFVEEGKLNWTTTLGELFADTVKPMHRAWEKVTLRQVLAHRASLRVEPARSAQTMRRPAETPRRQLTTMCVSWSGGIG